MRTMKAAVFVEPGRIELVGVIEKLGSAVTGYTEGQRDGLLTVAIKPN